jgi:hypothetical protein
MAEVSKSNLKVFILNQTEANPYGHNIHMPPERYVASTRIEDIDLSFLDVSRQIESAASLNTLSALNVLHAYDILNILYFCATLLPLWEEFALTLPIPLTLIIGDNASFKAMDASILPYRSGINILIGCSTTRIADSINKHTKEESERLKRPNNIFCMGMDGYIHGYGSGFLMCQDVGFATGVNYTETYNEMEGSPINKIIDLVIKSPEAIIRKCRFMTFTSMTSDITKVISDIMRDNSISKRNVKFHSDIYKNCYDPTSDCFIEDVVSIMESGADSGVKKEIAAEESKRIRDIEKAKLKKIEDDERALEEEQRQIRIANGEEEEFPVSDEESDYFEFNGGYKKQSRRKQSRRKRYIRRTRKVYAFRY